MKTQSSIAGLLATLLLGTLPLDAQVIMVGPAVIDRDNVDLANQLTYLDPATPIPMPGVVTSWSLWAKGAGDLSLQVFRPVSEGYQLVGQNPVEVLGLGLNTFDIAPAERISVSVGDVIGFRDNSSAAGTKVIAFSSTAGTENWTSWPDGGAYNVGIGGIIPLAAFNTGETRTYSLEATVTAVPEPNSAVLIGLLMLGGAFAARRRSAG